MICAATRGDFEARLREIGRLRYHDKHPFHKLLHSGGCTPDQVRAWVINRYYYQSRIPMKDAACQGGFETGDDVEDSVDRLHHRERTALHTIRPDLRDPAKWNATRELLVTHLAGWWCGG